MHTDLPCTSRRFYRFASALFLGVALFASSLLAQTTGPGETVRSFSIPGGSAEATLKTFSQQSGRSVMFASDKVRDVKTGAVTGDLTPSEALGRLLKDTGLVALPDEKTGGYSVRRETPAEAKNGSGAIVARNDRPGKSDESYQTNEKGEQVLKLQTFEVLASKSLNMDIRRTVDDPQPYVIFDRNAIERSGAANLDDFLKTHLTMNTTSALNTQQANGVRTSINLRGLGTNQTLVLVDGRRLPSNFSLGNLRQPDISGIPLAAIDRIDVLTSSASGIYGGGATGGVVNIILKHDYRGVETTLTYENSFATDTAVRRANLTAGFSLERGKTNILLSGSWSDQHSLLLQDLPNAQSYRYRILENTNFNYNGPAFTDSGVLPPLGATTNIHSRDGSNLTLKTGASLNSPIAYVPDGYLGTSTDGGAAFLATAGKYNLNLARDVSVSKGGALAGILDPYSSYSFNANVRRQFGKSVEGYVDWSMSKTTGHFPTGVGISGLSLSASSPLNPFNQSIRVMFPIPSPFGEQSDSNVARHLSIGTIIKLPADWKALLDYSESHARERNDYHGYNGNALFTSVPTGALDVLRDLRINPPDFGIVKDDSQVPVPAEVSDADGVFRISGPMHVLLANPVQVSGLLEHRREAIGESGNIVAALDGTVSSSSSRSVYPSRSQSVDSAYLELSIPVIGTQNARTGIDKLELQFAGRQDRYVTNGVNGQYFTTVGSTTPPTLTRQTTRTNSTNPTVAIMYKPGRALTFRASYATGFLPPTVNQITPTASRSVTILDPKRGSSQTVVPLGSFLENGNPNLRPEHSKSWTAGIIYTPEAVEGLRVSLDYTRITKRDAIADLPGGPQGLVNNEALFPDRIIRGAPLAGDPAGYSGPIVALNDTLFNLASAEVTAFDLQLEYRKKTAGWGEFDFFAYATWQPHYKTRILATEPLVENVGFSSSNPLEYKANAGVDWSFDRFTLGWTTRYFNNYLVYLPSDALATRTVAITSQGATHIPSQFYSDVFAKYRFGGGAGGRAKWLLANTELTIGVKNVFNTLPPFDSSNPFYGAYSYYGDPRNAVYWISVKKAF